MMITAQWVETYMNPRMAPMQPRVSFLFYPICAEEDGKHSEQRKKDQSNFAGEKRIDRSD